MIIFHWSKTYAVHDELKLLSQLNNFFNFDHNIFLIHSSVDTGRFMISTRGPGHLIPTPQSLYLFKSTDDNSITGLENVKKIWSKNTFVIVVPRNTEFKSNILLLVRVKEIQRLQDNMKIGIFFTNIASSEDFLQLFKWCWSEQIINIFAVTQTEVIQGSNPEKSLNIFTFNPFGTFDVINVTGSELYDRFFLSQYSNFQRYSYSTKQYMYETDKKFWHTLFGVMNASFDNTHVNVIPTARHVVAESGGHSLYPIEFKGYVILVPEALPYPGFVAYLQAFTTRTLLAYLSITIAVIVIFLSFFRFKSRRKFFFFESVTDVLNLLLNDNGYINYQRLSGIEILCIVPLTFAGLIFVNGFLSAFQSYLTRPIDRPQIDTVKDLYDSPYLIYVQNDTTLYKPFDQIRNLTEYGNWSNKVREIGFNSLYKQFTDFNRSISFTMPADYAGSLMEAQKRLNIKGYHVCQIQLMTKLSTYTVMQGFPFVERVNEFIHRGLSSGLFKKWSSDFSTSIENKIMKYKRQFLENGEETGIKNFEMPIFLAYGWIASLIMFVIEIIWKKLMILRIVKISKVKSLKSCQ